MTSVRLLHCTSDSHNTQYVNKPLIYIIKTASSLIPPKWEIGQGALRPVISSAAKSLMDGVKPTALWTGVGMDSARV
jgi:hypothetical protein